MQLSASSAIYAGMTYTRPASTSPSYSNKVGSVLGTRSAPPPGCFYAEKCGSGYTTSKVDSYTKICCPLPSAPAPAPLPAITVSPQISPVFQQQYQPTDSPMTAGTQQATAPPPPPPPAPVPTYSAPPAPAPYVPPAMPTGPAPAAYSGAIGPGPDIAYPPDLATAMPASVGGQAPVSASPEKADNTLLFGALGVLGILLLSQQRRKAKNATRRN